MERLYFDLFDGELISRDKEGSYFESVEAAQQSAMQSLLELIKPRPISDTAELMYV
jgi:hypothetical protein